MSDESRGDTSLRPPALVLLPGGRAASALAIVLHGVADGARGLAIHGGFDTVAVIAPGEARIRVGELGPNGVREAGADALLAAAAACGSRVDGRLGAAEVASHGVYRLTLGPAAEPTMLTPGIVGAAISLDPEFISDTGRRPALLTLPSPVLVVPVEDRQCVEEARPNPEIIDRLVPGTRPELIVLFVSGPEGTSLPDPLPVTVFRGGTWPRPISASAGAAAALAGLDDLLPPGTARAVIFTPARVGESASDVATMRVSRDVDGTRTVMAAAERLI